MDVDQIPTGDDEITVVGHTGQGRQRLSVRMCVCALTSVCGRVCVAVGWCLQIREGSASACVCVCVR